jgi:hypothetical protein
MTFQDPKHLATANFQRSKEEKVEDDLSLIKARNEENEKKRQKMVQVKKFNNYSITLTESNVPTIQWLLIVFYIKIDVIIASFSIWWNFYGAQCQVYKRKKLDLSQTFE